MLKYTLIGIVAGLGLIAAGFYVLARYNDRNAEAGPAQPVLVIVGPDGALPASVRVPRGRFLLLAVNNRSGVVRNIFIEDGGIEQLPVQEQGVHGSGDPQPGLSMLVTDGGTATALVRFTSRGRRRLPFQPPGRPEQAIVIEFIVD